MGEFDDAQEATEAAFFAAANSSCWCAETRKRCTYHEGFEDGYEAALVARAADARLSNPDGSASARSPQE